MCVSLFACGLLYLPHGAMILSIICYCGISWSYSLDLGEGTSKQHTAFSHPLGEASDDPGIKL